MSTEVVLKRVEEEKKNMEAQLLPLETKFKTIAVENDADFERLDSDVKMVKKLIKDADTIFDSTIDSYYRPYVFWRDIKGALVKRLKVMEDAGKKLLISFKQKRDEEIAEAQRKAQAEADAKAKKETEKLNKQADKAEAKGDTAKAEELRAQAETVHVPAAPVEAQAAPDIKGSSISYRWSAECVDLMALVKAVAEGRAPLNLVEANGPALNKQAQATKDTFSIPGVKWIKTPNYSASTKGA